MRSRPPEGTLVALLRQFYKSFRWQKLQNYRQFPIWNTRNFRTDATAERIQCQRVDTESFYKYPQTVEPEKFKCISLLSKKASPNESRKHNPNAPPQEIAILGGGITGLSSAYYLSIKLPKANITIYESTNRLGGWLQTEHIKFGGGNIIFEQGPKTLRVSAPAGLAMLELILGLGLVNEVLVTPADSDAARNRYIYYPDHLVRMPGRGQNLIKNLWEILKEPVFQGLLPAILTEFSSPQRSPNVADESIGSLLQRRFGAPDIGDNIVSAIFHGIYAGDIYQLSAKSLLPYIWHVEGSCSLVKNAIKTISSSVIPMPSRDIYLGMDLQHITQYLPLRPGSVFTFKTGISALSRNLEMSLKKRPRVQIKMNHEIKRLQYDEQTDSVKIWTEDRQPAKYDRVISTISSRNLSCLSHKDDALPSLRKTHSVTVMVVNLYYTNPSILSVRGFGYLLPRSIPWEQNPECALGVVFDSDACRGQDTVPGVKITVMLGGHWWDPFTAYPDADEGAAMAKSVLKRHLGIDDEPAIVNVTLQRECIPQYTVGHDERMKSAHYELLKEFRGRLAVAGNSYTGVALNDCVRAAREVALKIGAVKGAAAITGLEQFLTERQFFMVPKSQVIG